MLARWARVFAAPAGRHNINMNLRVKFYGEGNFKEIHGVA
jgi:hypothetical protein